MKKKEYLNEKSYNKMKNILLTVGIIIIVAGLCVGGFLIKKGVDKLHEPDIIDIDTNNKDITSNEQDVEKNKEELNNKKAELEKEKNELNSELASLKAQKSQEFRTNGFSEEYYKLDNEIDTKNSRVSKIDLEISKIDNQYSNLDKTNSSDINSTVNGIFNSTVNQVNSTSKLSSAMPYFMFGGFIIILSLIIGGSIIIKALRREFLAFGVQQVMPVAQEGIDKMSPTIGNAAGNIAQGITKGIKDGLNSNSNNNE